MSIAVSTLVRPSRLLRLALAGFAVLNLAAALALAAPNVRAACLSAACAGAATAAALAAARRGMTRQIDISGLGEIHLSVQQSLGTADAAGSRMRLLRG